MCISIPLDYLYYHIKSNHSPINLLLFIFVNVSFDF